MRGCAASRRRPLHHPLEPARRHGAPSLQRRHRLGRCRALGFVIVADPQDVSRRLWLLAKNNVARVACGLALRMVEREATPGIAAPAVEWESVPVAHTPDQALDAARDRGARTRPRARRNSCAMCWPRTASTCSRSSSRRGRPGCSSPGSACGSASRSVMPAARSASSSCAAASGAARVLYWSLSHTRMTDHPARAPMAEEDTCGVDCNTGP